MQVVSRAVQNRWWLLAGTSAMLLAALVGPQLAQPSLHVRWSGVLLVAALGGVTTALVGPLLLPVAVARGRRLRPLTQGAGVGLIAAAVMAVGVSLAPDLLAPVELRVGHGAPDVLLDQLQWAVPAAGIAGAVLGLAAWAVLTERDAVRALGTLIRRAGWATHVVWTAAAVTTTAAVLTATVLAAGTAGAGPVAQRAAAVEAAGAGWPLSWAVWGLADLGLLAVLALLTDRVEARWRPLALAAITVALTADLIAVTVQGVALPALAGSDLALFALVERSALALSGLVGNVVYGTVGLLLVRGAGRRLHPALRLVGAGAFAAAIASGVAMVVVPGWIAPVVGVSIGLFVAFAAGFGWQLAVSRRAAPALEAQVRDAARALVPLHPVPFAAHLRDFAAIELDVDAAHLATQLPRGVWLAPGHRARLVVFAGTATDARAAGLPAALGLPPMPIVVARADTVDATGTPRVTFLRGWADDTLVAAATHWLTELQLSRVDLEVAAADGRWTARGSAGALAIDLRAAEDARPSAEVGGMVTALVERGQRTASVDIELAVQGGRPAAVASLRVPFLDRLDAKVVGATLLGEAELRSARARWALGAALRR